MGGILRHFLKVMFLAVTLVFLLAFGIAMGYGYSVGKWFYHEIYLTVPLNPEINTSSLNLASYYYDATGKEIYQEYHDVNRTIIPYEKIPESLINAVVAIEDREFFSHKGVSPRAILRAIYYNYYLKTPSLQGGSTITQQLAKNMFLSSDQTMERKLKEMLYALRLERKYTKPQILEFYLNTVSFGGTAYGVEAASQQFFRKPTEELNLAESSFLAGLPAAPTRFSPLSNLPEARERQKLVLFAMQAMGKISWKDVQNTYWENIDIHSPESTITYPHFVYYTQELLDQVGSPELLKAGGMEIHTTIDPTIQGVVQQIVQDEVKKLTEFNISNAAVLVTRNTTGEIVAMVGSKDYYAQDIDGFVNLTNSLRQPGSSIKPLNYALYLENGHTLSSILKDTKITYDQPNGEKYTPENYDSKFRGNVTVRRALANSLNIPAVKALEENGVEDFAQFVTKFGLDPWPPENYGLALALGAGEVRMVKMNQAFSVFPNLGKLTRVTPIRYILDSRGDVVYYNPCLLTRQSFGEVQFITDPGPCQQQIIPQETAFLVTSVLTDNKTRTEAFGPLNVLNVPGTGAKTGTTNNFRDNWTFGFNAEYTVGVWVGNNDNTPMSPIVSGVTGAAPIWQRVISALNDETDWIDLTKMQPFTVEKVKVCSARNTLPCNSCATVEEYYIKGTAPTLRCLDPKPKEEEKKEDEKKD